MGRYQYSGRVEADHTKKIQVWFLKKHGYLNQDSWKSGVITWTHGWSGNKNSVNISVSTYESNQHLNISYTQTDRDSGESKDFDYKIPLITTTCHFGGKRYWFRCPFSRSGRLCGRRVGVIYKAGDYFACRHCYNLTYESRKLSGIWKDAGQVISCPELEELRDSIKKTSYRGKYTKRYKAYLKKNEKSMRQLMIVAHGLGGYQI